MEDLERFQVQLTISSVKPITAVDRFRQLLLRVDVIRLLAVLFEHFQIATVFLYLRYIYPYAVLT